MANPYYSQATWQQDTTEIIRYIKKNNGFLETDHSFRRKSERGISRTDVNYLFLKPHQSDLECIQGHAKNSFENKYGKKNEDELRVFYGKRPNGDVLHVVVAIKKNQYGNKSFALVSVLYPSRVYFKDDLKTLRPQPRFDVF